MYDDTFQNNKNHPNAYQTYVVQNEENQAVAVYDLYIPECIYKNQNESSAHECVLKLKKIIDRVYYGSPDCSGEGFVDPILAQNTLSGLGDRVFKILPTTSSVQVKGFRDHDERGFETQCRHDISFNKQSVLSQIVEIKPAVPTVIPLPVRFENK